MKENTSRTPKHRQDEVIKLAQYMEYLLRRTFKGKGKKLSEVFTSIEEKFVSSRGPAWDFIEARNKLVHEAIDPPESAILAGKFFLDVLKLRAREENIDPDELLEKHFPKDDVHEALFGNLTSKDNTNEKVNVDREQAREKSENKNEDRNADGGTGPSPSSTSAPDSDPKPPQSPRAETSESARQGELSLGSASAKHSTQNNGSHDNGRLEQTLSIGTVRRSAWQVAGVVSVIAVVAISWIATRPLSSAEVSTVTSTTVPSQTTSSTATGRTLRVATASRTYRPGDLFRFSVASPVPCQLEVHATDAAGNHDRIVPAQAHLDSYALAGGNRQQPFPDGGSYQIRIDDTPGPMQVTAICTAADGTRLSGGAEVTVLQ